MDITCWNCKTVTKLDKAAIEAAIAAMDATKLGFHDVACPSCGKANRTPRDAFAAGLQALSAASAPAKQAGSRLSKEEKKEIKAEVKKMKKGG